MTAPDFASYAAARRTHLRRTAYLLCGDWDRAEDLVQDALARLYVHWRRASRADNVDAYVRRTLVNAYLADRRRPWSRDVVAAELPDATGRAKADTADAVADRDALRTALKELGPSQRAVVVLRYWEDLSVEQTAAALNCSTGNVKSQAARGLARLREVLGRRCRLTAWLSATTAPTRPSPTYSATASRAERSFCDEGTATAEPSRSPPRKRCRRPQRVRPRRMNSLSGRRC